MEFSNLCDFFNVENGEQFHLNCSNFEYRVIHDNTLQQYSPIYGWCTCSHFDVAEAILCNNSLKKILPDVDLPEDPNNPNVELAEVTDVPVDVTFEMEHPVETTMRFKNDIEALEFIRSRNLKVIRVNYGG